MKDFETRRSQSLELAQRKVNNALLILKDLNKDYYDSDVINETKRLEQQVNRLFNVRKRRKVYLNDGLPEDYDYDEMYLYYK